jgi:hypothetical protein
MLTATKMSLYVLLRDVGMFVLFQKRSMGILFI